MSTATIKHRVGIGVRPETIYSALTDPKRLAQWWSEGAEGQSRVGQLLKFRFGTFVQPMEVTALDPSRCIRWKPTADGAPFWAGTEIEFQLERDEGRNQTLVYFTHSKWPDTNGMFAKSSMKWAVYLLSLKEFMEEGNGRPFPNETPCDHD